MMNIKRITIAIILVLAMTVNCAYASILGSTLLDTSSIDIGAGTTLYSNIFYSDQSGVGKQTEYYSVYTPNTDVLPVVLTGEDIYGKRTASEIIEFMKKNEMVPMIGINASFFSLQTGIPMGHVITNGVVTSKDNRTLPGVGFRNDGTAFIADMYIETTAHFGEDYLLQIPHINKYISKETQMLTLFTHEFGETTGTSTETINVILENISDSVRIGKSFTCNVKDIVKSAEPLKIEENQFVLSVNSNGNPWAISLIEQMQVGEELTIKTTASDEVWNTALNGLASEGERLLTNGTVKEKLEAGAAPRTAVGIKSSGEIIFYVIDGRQSGYSYGVKKETLAKRLLELGCVDAINLDGGGSTTIAGIYPGCEETAVMNSPSDKTQRKVTNFMFLQNVSEKTGIADKLYIYPYSKRILKGSDLELTVKAVDENYHTTKAENVVFESDEKATVSEYGVLTVLGEGDITIRAENETAFGTVTYQSIATPDEIKLIDTKTNKEFNATDVLPGEKYIVKAQALYNKAELVSQNKAYEWIIPENSNVSVDINSGTIEIGKEFSEETTLILKAGERQKEYKISLGARSDNDNMYPEVSIDVIDGIMRADIQNSVSGVSLYDTYIKVDGKTVDISDCVISGDESYTTVEYTLPEDFHRIYIEASTQNGNVKIATYAKDEVNIENVFYDTENHWAKNTISYMNKMGVVNGSTENGKLCYRPSDLVTRAEFAVMMVNFLGLNPEEYTEISLDGFEDRNTIPSWAENYVKAVYANKIINGKDNNGKLYFDPSAKITRAETATIISRVLPEKLQKKSISFNDKDDIANWAKDPIAILCTQKLLNGYEDNTVRASNNVTRAEAVTMIYNIY